LTLEGARAIKRVGSFIAVFVIGVGLVVALGALDRSETGERLRHRMIYGPEPERGECASVGLSIAENGQVWLSDGSEERISVGWVKSDVTSAAGHVSGTLSMLNQDEVNTKYMSVSTGGFYCVIRNTTEERPLWEHYPGYPEYDAEYPYERVVAVFIGLDVGVPITIPTFYWWYHNDPGPWNTIVDFDFAMSGEYMERQEVQTPDEGNRPDAAHIVYSYELSDENRWQMFHPVEWSVTFGGASVSGIQTYDEENEEWTPGLVGPIYSINFEMEQSAGMEGVQCGQIDLAWDSVDFDLSRYWKEYNHFKLEGAGQSIEAWMTDTDFSLNQAVSVGIGRPFIIDLSEFAVVDRDGELCEDLCVNVPVQASNHYPASLGWATTPDGQTFGAEPGDKVYPTVRQLRDVGKYADPAGVSGLDYRDPDDQYKLITSHVWAPRLTEESVLYYDEEYGHDPQDLRIPVLVTGINETSLSAAPEYEDLLSIAHAGSVSVYGPEDDKAHTVEDWVGSNGCTSPNATGAFTSDGSTGAALTLELASNYEYRLSRIPEQVFPLGMLGVPEMYFYRRAGLWREYDGELDQNGEVWSEPAEACYCADGFSALNLPLNGPNACKLTVVLTVKTFEHHDWARHPGSIRQREYSYTPVTTKLTYEVEYAPDDDIPQILLAVPAETTNPEFTVVEKIEISGFAAGDWEWTDDPTWGRDRNSEETPEVKLFEGPIEQYVIGGQRAVVDSTYRFALGDARDGNGGHKPVVEEMVLRIADYVESEPPPEGPMIHVDHTAVYSLGQQANRITLVCNAWTGTLNEGVLDQMCYSAEDDAYYSMLYAFNAPVNRNVGEPLVEPVSAMTGAIICGSTTLASGLLTPIRGYKVIGGAMEGILRNKNILVRDDTSDSIWRRPATGGGWEQHDTPHSNSAGYWRSVSGNIYYTHDPASVLYEYGIGSSDGSSITSIGRFAAREWVSHYAELEKGVWVRVHTDPVTGVQWCAVLRNGKLAAKHRTTGIAEWCADIVIADAGDYQTCDITGDGNLLIVLAITSDGTIDQFWTRTDGDTWDGPETI
jgi:hypothetical protein